MKDDDVPPRISPPPHEAGGGEEIRGEYICSSVPRLKSGAILITKQLPIISDSAAESRRDRAVVYRWPESTDPSVHCLVTSHWLPDCPLNVLWYVLR